MGGYSRVSETVQQCSECVLAVHDSYLFFFKFPDLCLTKSIAETQLDGEGEEQPGCTKDLAALSETCGTPPGKVFKASNEVVNFFLDEKVIWTRVLLYCTFSHSPWK